MPVRDMVQCLFDQDGYLVHPVDRADVATRGVENSPKLIGVLDRAPARGFRRQLRIGEPATSDQVVQFRLGGLLSRLDVGVECADQDVDRFVSRT